VHPLADLSAYLDGALGHAERASVETHLAGCAACRSRLAQLADTVRLIAALPDPVPARRLVPRVSIPFWMAPMRTVAALASGTALFLFLASAVLANLPQTQTTGAAPAAAPAPARPLTSASAAPGLAAGGATAEPPKAVTAATTSPGAAFASVATPAPSTLERSTLQTDAAKGPGESPRPAAAQQDAASSPTVRLLTAEQQPDGGPSPWLWLAFAAAFGGMALFLQRRLRAR